MKVRLAQPMSGSRNGVPWPEVGSVVEVPDEEGQAMLNSGHAVATNAKDKPESSLDVPDKVDDAVEKFIPETARHQPSIGVENLPDEDRKPVLKNVGLTDDGEIAHGPVPLSDQAESEPVDMTANDPQAKGSTGAHRGAESSSTVKTKATSDDKTANKVTGPSTPSTKGDGTK